MSGEKRYGIISYEDGDNAERIYYDHAFSSTNPTFWSARDVIELIVWVIFLICLLIFLKMIYSLTLSRGKKMK